MSLCRDKQVRHFCIFLFSFSLLCFILAMRFFAVQEKAVQNMFITHDSAVVTSLLEQGVSQKVIAKAITNTSSHQEGIVLLANIGVTEHTMIRFLPFVSELQRTTGNFMILTGVILAILLFCGTFYFLWKRERLYQQASQVIQSYTKGDFSCHMPQMYEGSIYQLFSSVEQLTSILQSKNETVIKTKELLKHTISDISHQLKTPLTALSMYHEIISEEPDNIVTVKEFSARTGLALKRMEQLIQAMLKITRLDTSSIVFEQNNCRIQEMISLSIGELTTRAVMEGKEIQLDGSLEETICCDQQWTSEAIGNVVKNALDHTVRGGKIQISWENTPIMTRIYITDNGSGIAIDDLPHIFKRFYRSKNSLDTQGVGLGLSLAKSIMEGQNGNISVQSSLNEGTTFVLSFLTKL